MSEERTEKATPRRKQKAREQGDRPRSRELLAGSATLAGVLALGALAPGWVAMWARSYQEFLALGDRGSLWERDTAVEATRALRGLAMAVAWPTLLLFAAVVTAGCVAGMAQGGGLQFYAPALQPKFERLNPLSNLKNLVSPRSLVRLGKSLLPAVVLLALAWGRLQHQAAIPPMSLARMPAMFEDAYHLLIDASCILFAWSAVDFLVEWRSWEKRLRMSKQEIREEYKESEGNPQVRGRIRSIQRQMRRRQMRSDVQKASVVVTNPTHYAIALSFDFDVMDAPRVVAKGRNLFAEEIKKEARWAGVPIVENPPLARSLYRTVEVGRAIPAELYAAVASILAYLYRRQVEERMRRQREEAARRAAAKDVAASPAKQPRPSRTPTAADPRLAPQSQENA